MKTVNNSFEKCLTGKCLKFQEKSKPKQLSHSQVLSALKLVSCMISLLKRNRGNQRYESFIVSELFVAMVNKEGENRTSP